MRRRGADGGRAAPGAGGVLVAEDVKPRRRRLRWWLEAASVGLLAVPLIVLFAAGITWLWQRGWLLWYLLGATTLAFVVWGTLRYRHRPRPVAAGPAAPTITRPEPTWAPHEQAAWETVRRLSA